TMVERGNLWAALASEADTSDGPIQLLPDYLDVSAERESPPNTEVADVRSWPTARDAGEARDPLELSLLTVAEALRARELSPVELCERCLARAAERAEPWNAFAELLPERARAAAQRAE